MTSSWTDASADVSKSTHSRPKRRAPSADAPHVIDPPAHEVFLAAVETARVPMIVTDPKQQDNPIVFANNAFLEMTGYDRDEVLGHNSRLLQGHETDPASVDDIRRAIIARQQIAVEILNYRKNGSSFWNALVVSPIFDRAGELVYFFASHFDVSRRRDAENALGQAQKMEAIGQLTGGIAHDFNNLLQIISGYLDVLESGLNKPAPDLDRQRRGLRNMRGAADRAAALTQQLLAFARRQKPQGRTLNLNIMLESMDALIARTVGYETSITRTFAADLWNCRIDPTQAELAIVNILINAHDAMAGRDAALSIETINRIIEAQDAAHGLRAGRYVELSITDSGLGIPASVLDRVMEPFFTTKREGKGTGLGLSMVHAFAKQSEGAVQIVSREGEGTTIRLLFPATNDVVPAPGASTHPVHRHGHETILVVDDRREIADIAAAILDDCGYRTRLAYGTTDALAVLAGEEPIDLLFTDMIMPGTYNGVTLAHEARKRRPDLPVLITTGYAEGLLEAAEDGAGFEVLAKPYKRDELLRKIRLVLDRTSDG